MAKSQETFSKKEAEKKKAQKRKAKEQRKEERKANNAKTGSSLEDMMAYVDEYGNITSTPPDPNKKKNSINVDDIVIGARNNVADNPADAFRKGKIMFFNEAKGYGFIKDLQSQESIFVHINQLTEVVKENDKVAFEVERGPKGLSAVRVKKTS